MSLKLRINDRFINRDVEFFNEFTFTIAYDSIASSFGFNFYFDPENPDHVELTTVGHYHEVQLLFNNELVLTGNLINHTFKVSSTKQLTKMGGYALPGVLEDCEIPHRLYPLQNNGLSFEQICRKLIRPFKLGLVVDPDVQSIVSKAFPTATATPTQRVKGYLTQLASQKDIVLSHDEKGQLLLTRAKTKQDSIIDFDLREAVPEGTTFEFSINGQGIHSHITVQRQASSTGGNAGQTRLRNPYVIGSVFRPTTKSQSSGDDNDTGLAARRELGNELKNLRLTISTSSWLINGKIIRPNNIITIIAPELYIFRQERFFIESVSYTGNNKQTTATLNCVLPNVYDTEPIVNIFRGINIHPPHGVEEEG